MTVGHVYNAYQAGKRFTAASGAQTADFSAMNVGLGWKLSVQESVVERTISGALWLVYGDADGTEHYFYDFDSDGKYESEDGYGLTITRNTASTSAALYDARRLRQQQDVQFDRPARPHRRRTREPQEPCLDKRPPDVDHAPPRPARPHRRRR